MNDNCARARCIFSRTVRIAALPALLLSGGLSGPSSIPAQVRVGGQVSSALVKSNTTPSQYSFNRGRASFMWRADILFDAEITGNILFLGNLRLTQDETIHIDLFTIRFVELAGPGVNLDIGVVDVPFLNIGSRRFPKTNPFISLPIGREHYTTLCSSDNMLWNADTRHSAGGDGYRILDGPLYDLGAKFFGSTGILDYAVGITNGSVSSSGSYSPEGLNDNRGFGKSVRMAVTPVPGFTLGISYARGPFLHGPSGDGYGYQYAGTSDPAEHVQEILGLDLDYSFDYFSLYGEGFLNRWKYDRTYGADLQAGGFSAEVRFVPVARISFAARVGGIFFNTISPQADPSDPYAVRSGERWDRDIIRTEGAFGYRLNREVLVKAVYQHVNTIGVIEDPFDDTIALQIVATF